MKQFSRFSSVNLFNRAFVLSILFLLVGTNHLSAQEGESEKKEDKTKKKDLPIENITFLNAANFDFSTNLDANYLGKLNIYAPNISNTRFGFIAGIMRIKFNYNDTSGSRYFIENRKIKPLDSMNHGNRFLREYNKYTTSRSNIVWSFYVQPMIRIIPLKGSNKNLENGIYFHLHTELLVNKTNVTATIENLQRDTLLVDTSKRGISYIYQPGNTIIIDKTYLNGYFGAGLTFSFYPFGNKNSRFFFQPTIGFTTNTPTWVAQEISSTSVNVIPVRSGVSLPQNYQQLKSAGFYLVRAEFVQNLSDNSQVIIGTDIRGLLPKYNPQYAAYVGLNVNLDALANIFSNKNKKDEDE